MKKLFFILSLFVFSQLSLQAQKTRSVVDDAMTLMDLLYKDYTSIADQAQRMEEMQKDRQQVINILKAYVKQNDISEAYESNDTIFESFSYKPRWSTHDINIIKEEIDEDRLASLQKDLKSLKKAFNNEVQSELIWEKLPCKVDLSKPDNIKWANMQCLIDAVNSDESLENSFIEIIKRGNLEIGKHRNLFVKATQALKTLTWFKAELTYFKAQYDLRKLNTIFDNDTIGSRYLADLSALFLKKYNLNHTMQVDNLTQAASGATLEKATAILGGGSLAFTKAVDGLARFLAQRFKEELTTQVVEKIQNALSNPDRETDKLLELKILLPETTKFLLELEPDQYSGALESLKAKVELDINNLFDNLPKLENTPRIDAFLSKNPELRMLVEGLKLVEGLSKANHPLDYLSTLEYSSLFRTWKTSENNTLANLSNGVSLMAMMGFALSIEQEDGRSWVKKDAWQKYSDKNYFYMAFIGMLAQQDRLHYEVKFGNGKGKKTPLYQSLNNVNSSFAELTKLRNRIEPEINLFLIEAERLNNQIVDIKKLKRNGKKVSADTLYNYINSTIDFLESGLTFSDSLVSIVTNKQLNVSQKYGKFLEASRKGADIFLELKRKSYANAVMSGLDLYFALIDNGDVALDSIKARLPGKVADMIKEPEFLKLKAMIKVISDNDSARIQDGHLTGLKTFAMSIIPDTIKSFIAILDSLPAGSIHINSEDTQYSQLVKLNSILQARCFIKGFPDLSEKYVTLIGEFNDLITKKCTIKKEMLDTLKGLLKRSKSGVVADLEAKLKLIDGLIASDLSGDDLVPIKDLIQFLTSGQGKELLLRKYGLYDNWVKAENLVKLWKGRKDMLEGRKGKLKKIDGYVNKLDSALIDLLSGIDKEATKDVYEELKDCLEELAKEKFNRFVDNVGNSLDPKTRETIVKTVNFVMAVAKAESTEEAEAAIAAIALPSGSSIIKRKSRFSISLNAYLGAYLAIESLENREAGQIKLPITISFAAPIGPAFSWGTRKSRSWTIFMSVIDIGAVTRLRLDGNDDKLPEITIENIIAPGAHIIHGFKNSPFSVGFGAQYGPGLRKVTPGMNGLETVTQQSALRYGITATFDIPLFNIYTRSR